MPSLKPITAIFDIGKTNKKFLLFDENYNVVDKHQTKLEQTVDDDGDPCEDLEKLEAWILGQIYKAVQKHQIQALNFSTYGASFVHLNQEGKAATPLYNYLKSYPGSLLSDFYESVGGKEKFSLETASPPMGMLNSGLQLFWLKQQKKDLFDEIETSLHFPQYLSYLFTGKKKSELTSIGCHTGLWNFEDMKYHTWLAREDLQEILPPIVSAAKTTKTENFNRVGSGIHDSSAALAPYLIGLDDPFMLVSTGTWSITLNPFNDEPLAYDELQRDCLCYLDILGNQVKASRLFLGAEYSHQKRKIEKVFETVIGKSKVALDILSINSLTQQKNSTKVQLEQAYNSGPYPQENPGNWQVNHFPSYKEAYHQLILDLVAIQAESIKLAEGAKSIDKVIITGGFSQNALFTSLLASFFPNKSVYTSLLPDASALGAAMVVNEDLENASLARHDIRELLGLHRVKPIKGLNVDQYSWNE